MRIIIISGTIYPSLYPRSFRATELAIALSKMGHEVVLYGVLGDYDYSDFQKKHKVAVRQLGKSRWGNVNSDIPVNHVQRKITLKKLIHFICDKLFHRLIDFPYSEFFFLTKKVLKKEKQADLLITVAVPYGIHWAAAVFRKKHGNKKYTKWIADCGDPMLGSPMNNYFHVFLEPLERLWCRNADKIVVPFESAKDGYFEEFREKIEVIPQSIDFSSIERVDYSPNSVPTFLYCGSVYKGNRDPTELLEFLLNCGVQNFKFIVYSNSRLFNDYKEKLGERLDVRDALPRLELIKVQSSMDFLINIKNQSDVQLPSKLIDYALSGRPILNISSVMSEEEKTNLIKMLNGDYKSAYSVNNIEQFDSKNVAEQFLKIVQ